MVTELGGEWEQHARSIKVEAEGWVRGHHVPTAIHSVANYARLADVLRTKGALAQLAKALGKLELEIERYQHRMTRLRQEVGYLTAIVHRARDEAPDLSDDELDDQRRERLLALSDVGIDDAIIRRAAQLHRPER